MYIEKKSNLLNKISYTTNNFTFFIVYDLKNSLQKYLVVNFSHQKMDILYKMYLVIMVIEFDLLVIKAMKWWEVILLAAWIMANGIKYHQNAQVSFILKKDKITDYDDGKYIYTLYTYE